MKLFIITGQTATGKTEYAVKLAKNIPPAGEGELINCDSRQIYKKLDIITGKDRPKNSKIWLYDIVDPKQYFSSFDWVEYALKTIKEILSRGKTPIIVGGTYFYLYHLLYDVDTQHIKPNWRLRNKLNQKSVLELQKMFQKLSLQSFKRLNNSDKNNPQRLIRKIEILTHNKNSKVDSFQIPHTISLPEKLGVPIQIKYIGLKYTEIHILEEKIKKRVGRRMNHGAVEEVRKLLKKGYSAHDPGLKTIGYTQVIKYVKREISKKQALEEWISKELQYAKRQYTFMKKDPHISWIYV